MEVQEQRNKISKYILIASTVCAANFSFKFEYTF
jgi:hypothetical protein